MWASTILMLNRFTCLQEHSTVVVNSPANVLLDDVDLSTQQQAKYVGNITKIVRRFVRVYYIGWFVSKRAL